MTDIKEPIDTTSDGTFLSVVCENPKKVLLAKSWGGHSPPSPPRNYPPVMFNSTQDKYNIDDGSGGSDVGM